MVEERRRNWVEATGHLSSPVLGLSDHHQQEFDFQIERYRRSYPAAKGGYIELAAATNFIQVLCARIHDEIRHDPDLRHALEQKIRDSAADRETVDIPTVIYQSLPWRTMEDLAKETEQLAATYKNEGADKPLPTGATHVKRAQKIGDSFAEAIGKNDARLNDLATALENNLQMIEAFAEHYGSDFHPDDQRALQDAATLARHYSKIAENLEPESPDTWKKF